MSPDPEPMDDAERAAIVAEARWRVDVEVSLRDLKELCQSINRAVHAEGSGIRDRQAKSESRLEKLEERQATYARVIWIIATVVLGRLGMAVLELLATKGAAG